MVAKKRQTPGELLERGLGNRETRLIFGQRLLGLTTIFADVADLYVRVDEAILRGFAIRERSDLCRDPDSAIVGVKGVWQPVGSQTRQCVSDADRRVV